MAEYIDREAAIARLKRIVAVNRLRTDRAWFTHDGVEYLINEIPAADVIEEENVLKFYYVRSIDDYWIGRRVGNFYYAEFDPEALRWTWTHSRYLPWGEHVVSPTSLWKEHTYPSEPEGLPFEAWLRGLFKKLFPIDPRPVVRGEWVAEKEDVEWGCSAVRYRCSHCGRLPHFDKESYKFLLSDYCPKCGADMREAPND